MIDDNVIVRLFRDDDHQICALCGDDLQTGLAGFGDTVPEALASLAIEWELANKNVVDDPGRHATTHKKIEIHANAVADLDLINFIEELDHLARSGAVLHPTLMKVASPTMKRVRRQAVALMEFQRISAEEK